MDAIICPFRLKAVRSYSKYQSRLHSGHLRQQQQVVHRLSCHVRRQEFQVRCSMSMDVLPASEKSAAGLGRPATQVPTGTRVVVLGGSIAGMLAAAAVAPYVNEVFVLDKETTLNGIGNEDQLRKVPMAFCLSTFAYP